MNFPPPLGPDPDAATGVPRGPIYQIRDEEAAAEARRQQEERKAAEQGHDKEPEEG